MGTPKVKIVNKDDKTRLEYHEDCLLAYRNLCKNIEIELAKKKGISALDKSRLKVELLDIVKPRITFHSDKVKQFEDDKKGS